MTIFSKENEAEYWFRFRRQTFRKVVRAFKESNMKQTELAKKIGRDPARVNKWLRGEENITLRTICMLARAMNYRPEFNLVPMTDLKLTNRFHDGESLCKLYPDSSLTPKVFIGITGFPNAVNRSGISNDRN